MPTRRSTVRSPFGLAAALVGALVLAPLHAQERPADTRAPIIEIESLGESTADATQTFTAQVADDRELAGVSLHHRRAGQQPFARVPMPALGANGYYGVSLTTDPDDLRPIEYYVQAIDETGNRTVNGFAFDPLVRTLLPRAGATAAPVPPDDAPIESSGRPRWWAVALGVLAVGALVSLAGSDGGDEDTVPLVIDLPEPSS